MALGAVIGQAIGYRKLGWKAPVYGAIGGLIPDLDVLYTDYFGPYGTWLYHRHITHSIFFPPVVAPLLAWATWAIHKKQAGHYRTYLWIWFWSIITHGWLDTLTVYGTMLLSPFSNARFSVPAMSIIDPVYSLMLFVPIVMMGFARAQQYIPRAAIIALILSSVFIAHGYRQNVKAENIAHEQIAAQNITPVSVTVYTTVFQPYLRRIVVRETIDGHEWLRVGYVSTINPQPIHWACLKQNGNGFRERILQTEGGRLFDWFADGELSFEQQGDHIIVMDARYGTPPDSIFGFWGLEFEVDGDLIATEREPAFVRAPREVTGDAIKGLFRAAYGLPNDFLPHATAGCP